MLGIRLLFLMSYCLCTILSSAPVDTVYAQRIAELGGRFTHVVVIGGGCAGLAAGFQVAYYRHPVVVFTGDKPGGQLMGSQLVENIPGMLPEPGYKIMEALQGRTEQQGAQVIYETVIDISYEAVEGVPLFVITTVKDSKDPEELRSPRIWCAFAVIFAMGGAPRMLGVPGEDQFLNKQIFTCAGCDGRMGEDKEVYVVGGGDASVDAIITLLGFGARRCTLLVRGNTLRANPAMQQNLLKHTAQVQIAYDTRIVEIRGDDDAMHTIVLEGPAGRTEVPAQVLFYAIGYRPMTDYVWVRRYVQCDNQGYVIVHGDQSTTFPGIFAAGDVASPQLHKATHAMGDAEYAAISAVKFCERYLTPQLRTLSEKLRTT